MRKSLALGALCLLVAAGACVPGCGGADGVNVDEGPMPEGGSFTGVWHSPQYGEMHMVQTGQQVVGEYTKDERHGRIQGTVRGNVMRFEWTEEREMVAGRPTTTRGRGFFRYAIGDDGDHYIQGRWGHDDEMTGGGPWNAVRDRRAEPQISGEDASSGDEDVEAFDTASGGGDIGGSGDRGGSDDDELDLGGL
ncbi:MAG TPA: hypothetical protein RMH99_26660 [Sandaracinaceae bacterium LLY-WYZ-13_1]|nr:hypothetical protein [Sandaracinaceae bacterium LLY-WYZ-13_1]